MVEAAINHKAVEVKAPEGSPSEYFGTKVFGREAMRRYLNKTVYAQLLDTPCPFYARRCLAWHVGIYKRNNRKNKLLKTHGYEERIYHLQTLRGNEECDPD